MGQQTECGDVGDHQHRHKKNRDDICGAQLARERRKTELDAVIVVGDDVVPTRLKATTRDQNSGRILIERSAAAAGLSVPRDLSVIAIHDTWFAPHLNPPLTTVRLPLAALGGTIVEQLIARLNGAAIAHVKIDTPPPELLRRNATGAPPATVV